MITFGEGLFNYGMIQGTEKGYKKGFDKGVKDGIKEGIKQGIKQGNKNGKIETLAKNVFNLSKSLNISNEEAMKLLKVSKKNQSEVINKIKHLSK